MSHVKHSTAPWRYDDSSGLGKPRDGMIVDSNGDAVALVTSRFLMGEARSNGAVLAAATNLLEACEAIDPYLDALIGISRVAKSFDLRLEAILKIRKAIKEARGFSNE